MTKKELFELLDDINALDTDFGTRLEFARLVVEYVKSIGGLIDADA